VRGFDRARWSWEVGWFGLVKEFDRWDGSDGLVCLIRRRSLIGWDGLVGLIRVD